MSRTQRDKGNRGQREALDVLAERGYQIAETGTGRKCEDLFGCDPSGHPVSVEVKHHAHTRWDDFRAQARTQAKARKAAWLLMCRLPDHPYTFVVEGDGIEPVVWRGNGAKQTGDR